jgi:DNA invertase Pin-like site-specific DNA recombinase
MRRSGTIESVRIAAYLRVSTDRQAEEGLGLDVQESACRKWAKANGHRLVTTFIDEGISGSNGLDTRVGLADALRALRKGEVAGIVVYRLDRLARDLVLQESLLAEIRRMGGQLYTTSAAESGYLTDDPDDPSRRLIRQVLGAVNEYERSMIALRLRSGRRAKAERGGFAYGSPAFGYRAKGGELVPAEAEQATVDRIAELHRSGASLRTICSTLESEGHRTKRGSVTWHPQVVARVVARLSTEGVA